MIINIIKNIRLFNIDILVNFISLFLSIFAIWKQKAKLIFETLNGRFYIDYFRGVDENGFDYIELLPFIRIINRSQLPITIYSIEVILKNSNIQFKSRYQYGKIKKIKFYDSKNNSTLILNKFLNFDEPINLGAYEIIDGHLDTWINGNVTDLIDAKIIVKTSRKKYIKSIKFNEINGDYIRKEIY